jgi:hypothetical protein
MTPEQSARQQIDLLLQQCGWIVQSRSETNLAAGPGVAIREALLKTGEADYLLFAGGKAIGTVEAKPEGYSLPHTFDPKSTSAMVSCPFTQTQFYRGNPIEDNSTSSSLT